MKHRHRVAMALAHEETDRCPMQISFTPEFAERVQQEVDSKSDKVHNPHGGGNTYQLERFLGEDMLLTSVGWANNYYQMFEPGAEYTDDWGVTWRATPYETRFGSGIYTEFAAHPLADAKAIDSYTPPDPEDPVLYRDAEALIRDLKEEYWIVGVTVTTIWETAWALRGLERLMMDLIENPELAGRILDIPYHFHLTAARKLVDMGVDMIWIGDDMGTQKGMVISPTMWRDVFKPRMATFVRTLKEINPDVKVAYHSCGDIAAIVGSGRDRPGRSQSRTTGLFESGAPERGLWRQAALLGIDRRAADAALWHAGGGSTGGGLTRESPGQERRPDSGANASRTTGHPYGEFLGHGRCDHPFSFSRWSDRHSYRQRRVNVKKRCLLLLAILFTSTVHAHVRIVESGQSLAIENENVRFVYSLSQGTYVATDKRDDTICIQDGHLQIDDVATNTPGFKHAWESRTISDELGKGKSILIKSSRPGQAMLLFEVTLYENRPYIVFGGGIENTTSRPVQLKLIKPIAEGTLFKGLDMTRNFRLLDGNGGGEPLEWGVKKYTAVYNGNYVYSRNNLLMTFGANETRRSLVMGGLSYHDYEKFATVRQPRKLELSKGPRGSTSLAGYLNLPDDVSDTGPAGESLCLTQGSVKRSFSYRSLWGDEIASAIAGQEGVALDATGLEANATYYLGFSWWHTDREDRVQSVAVDSGAGTKRHVLLDKQDIPLWHNKKKEDPRQVELCLPREVYESGRMRILFESSTDTPLALVNEVWLRKGSVPLLPAQLTPVNETARPRHRLTGSLYAEDPVGKRVDPGVRYLPDDRFYVDFITDNPFENLEQYGRSVQLAQKIELNMYDFPTVCLWYAHHGGYGGGKATNDTVGAVAEMEAIRDSGFLKYSRAAVRLVPDCYSKDNQQGWWDDEHFQRHGSTNLREFEGGTYKAPYETSEKWGKAITERGGIPLTYCQTGFRSEDYCHTFPEHMLFNNATAWMHESYKRPLDDDEFWGNAWRKSFRVWSYDYTDPGFVKHMREVYAAYRSGGILTIRPGAGQLAEVWSMNTRPRPVPIGISFGWPGKAWAWNATFTNVIWNVARILPWVWWHHSGRKTTPTASRRRSSPDVVYAGTRIE